jgi:hypothetical protein
MEADILRRLRRLSGSLEDTAEGEAHTTPVTASLTGSPIPKPSPTALRPPPRRWQAPQPTLARLACDACDGRLHSGRSGSSRISRTRGVTDGSRRLSSGWHPPAAGDRRLDSPRTAPWTPHPSPSRLRLPGWSGRPHPSRAAPAVHLWGYCPPRPRGIRSVSPSSVILEALRGSEAVDHWSERAGSRFRCPAAGRPAPVHPPEEHWSGLRDSALEGFLPHRASQIGIHRHDRLAGLSHTTARLGRVVLMPSLGLGPVISSIRAGLSRAEDCRFVRNTR